MSHTRFALGFPAHKKIAGLSDAAFRLWVSAMDRARAQGTDGQLDELDLDLVAKCPPKGPKRTKLIAELVAAGLWEPTDGGWQIHDYLDWQDSSERVRTLRERARERMALVRANRKRTGEDGADEQDDLFALDGSSINSGSDLPSDPVSASGSSLKRGARVARRKPKLPISADWVPKDQHRAKALKLGLNCDAEAEKFRNNAEGKDVRWVDWDKAFFNWLANGAVFASNGGNGKPPGAAEHERQQAAENARLVDQAKRGEYGERTRELAAEGRLVGDVLKRFKEAIRTGNLKRRPLEPTRPAEPVSSPRATTDDAVPLGAVTSLLGGIGRPMP